MKWFRLYSDAVDDEKLRLLAFEDRWHFVAIMCCKSSGLLDAEQSRDLMRRKVAVKLGVDLSTLDEIERRLYEVGLIKEGFQPAKWEKRQYLPNRGMPDTEDAKDRRGYVYFIGEAKGDRVKIGFSKNPWARLKNLQTASHAKLKILGHTRTTSVSEAAIHSALQKHRLSGEWFARAGLVESAIQAIKSGAVKDADDLERLLVKGGSCELATTVATTTDTDTESETEEQKNSGEPLFSFPLNDGSEYPITASQFDSFAALYPGIDLMQELRKIRGWCMSNPTKRKTKRGAASFVNNWLSRAQDECTKNPRGPTNGNANGSGNRRESTTERVIRHSLESIEREKAAGRHSEDLG